MAKLIETEWVWRDGEFVRFQDATVHVLAHSMQFGSAIFEGIRCYDTPRGPAIFRLEAHLERFIDTSRIYRMEITHSIDELVSASCELIERNKLATAYIRPMILRGFGAAGMVGTESPVETYIPCFPWGTYLGEGALENGVDACVTSWARMAPNTLPAMAKIAGNYLSGQLIKMEAMRNGYDEGFALTTSGMIAEGSGQNVFIVKNGEIFTPTINGSLLHGITRNTVITIAADLGLTVREQEMPREMFYVADEIFIVGTASEVTPVRSVDRIQVGAGRRGPVTTKIQQRYLDLVYGRAEDTHGWLTYVQAERAAKV